MKNYKNLRRIYEDDMQAISQADVQELGMQPEMAHNQEMPEMPIDYPAQQLALPAEGQTSAAPDPMTMTVGDFLGKCKEVDPLVCMGIQSFIDKNMHVFSAPAQPAAMTGMEAEPDLTFSNAVAPEGHMTPAPVPAFSLDQSPETLNFPG